MTGAGVLKSANVKSYVNRTISQKAQEAKWQRFCVSQRSKQKGLKTIFEKAVIKVITPQSY